MVGTLRDQVFYSFFSHAACGWHVQTGPGSQQLASPFSSLRGRLRTPQLHQLAAPSCSLLAATFPLSPPDGAWPAPTSSFFTLPMSPRLLPLDASGGPRSPIGGSLLGVPGVGGRIADLPGDCVPGLGVLDADDARAPPCPVLTRMKLPKPSASRECIGPTCYSTAVAHTRSPRRGTTCACREPRTLPGVFRRK